MEIVLSQIHTFGIMFVFGIFMGLVFDLYKLLSVYIKSAGKVILHITDLLFGLITGGAGFLLLLATNWGELRLYVFLAILLGIISYYYIRKLIILKKGG